MALVSPGVEVSIIDQSQYLPSPSNSVPLVILATAQNKANAAGTGVASATTAANAGKLFQVTSQRDLVDLYGTPFFYTSTNGTPIQGYELNEYGLLAAYSLLGVTNRCFVLRADVDLASLVGQTGRPVGAPDDQTSWLDTTNSSWGIYEFNATTGSFTKKTPLVISNPAQLLAGVPLASLGNIGDYAINSLQTTSYPNDPAGHTYFYKTSKNAWVHTGSTGWRADIPTIQTSVSSPALHATDTFSISMTNGATTVITVPAAPNNNVSAITGLINGLGWSGLTAEIRNGKLVIFSSQPGVNPSLTLTNLTGTSLADMGVAAGVYAQPVVQYGTSAQMPAWSASQASPKPTGSIWIKVGAAGDGLVPVVATYNGVTQRWVNKNVYLADNDWVATSAMDAAGGMTIPAGTIYGQYAYGSTYAASPLYLWKRVATGPTVITGTNTNPVFSGPCNLTVQVSIPGSSTLSPAQWLLIQNNYTATDFVTAWYAANIPYTTASVTETGAIQLTHVNGGEIVINNYSSTGTHTGTLETAGFEPGVTPGVKYGPAIDNYFTSSTLSNITGVGAGASIQVDTYYGRYILSGSGVSIAGSGYAIGNRITVSGSSLGGVAVANDMVIEVTAVDGTGGITSCVIISGSPGNKYTTQLSNWVEFAYTSNEGAPTVHPADNTNWFYSVVDQVDIMVQKGGVWKGYGNVNYDSTGHPAAAGVNATDPTGVIVSASAPTTQVDGSPLVYGDLWLDTTDLENYPTLLRWELVGTTTRWVLIDNTDQVSSKGIVFADARWATNGTVNPADDPIPTIASLRTSNYLDLDAPTATLYPQGTLLFNTRRSGYNVKQFRTEYFTDANFPDAILPTERSAWVTISGNQSDGSPFMGRKAQRAVVVQALNAAVSTNSSIRDEDNAFNLIAAPNYPELQPGMVTLNNDRGMTGFIIGDTPLRLANTATDIQAWANNTALATVTGEKGCVTRDTYLGLFYPSGITTDLSGNQVVVPASHMMLRTMLRSDNVSYPWLAPAGTRRGNIDNATNIGYLDAQSGEFQVTKSNMGMRDALYTNSINPLVFFTGVGLLNYGNKTSYASSSALDRINVARLIAFLRRQLTLAARPFVFEPNDSLTRGQIAGVVQTLLIELVAKRGLYDYVVVCDNSNNTPARIDRNELWIDVAIEPVKATEFIYIPVRILNTGALSGNQT